MGRLHQYLTEMLGSPVIVVMGDDNMGIIAKDNSNNYYIVNTKYTVIKTYEDDAMDCFDEWK